MVGNNNQLIVTIQLIAIIVMGRWECKLLTIMVKEDFRHLIGEVVAMEERIEVSRRQITGRRVDMGIWECKHLYRENIQMRDLSVEIGECRLLIITITEECRQCLNHSQSSQVQGN